MNHQDAEKRREMIAEAMRKLKSVARVAEAFNVSPALVRKACHEFGVETSSRPTGRNKLPREAMLAELRAGKSPADVARRYNISEADLEQKQVSVIQGGPKARSRKRKG